MTHRVEGNTADHLSVFRLMWTERIGLRRAVRLRRLFRGKSA